MQHHSMPPRPQHMRHPPMHQGPMHSGHPPPPPHMGMNMGIPPQQQQSLHMPNGAARRGPLPPQPYVMPHMRDQNRLGHHQHSQQQHQLPRLNNQMQQNQMQHHKGRPPPHVGGAGVASVGPLKYQNGQNNGPPPTLMRNNSQQSHQAPQSRLPAQQQQQQQQQLPVVANQVQILKGPPPLEQQQQHQMQHGQHPKINSCPPPPSHINNQQQIPHLSRPPPVQHAQQFRQQHPHKPIPVVNHGIPAEQQQQQVQQPLQQQQQRASQKFSHPRSILQNPNRSSHHHKNHIPLKTPLPTVSEVEIPIITSVKPSLTSSDKLSATAEDFTPKSLEKKQPPVENKDGESNSLIPEFMSVVMKGDGVFQTTKEKTPMCLVNELARFNKIQHQYRLTSENGPAHCKRFTVTLKLGEEEYSAEGYKIKKAQHIAAAEAIKKTKYKHPLPKTRRPEESSLRTTITPTVELNALAMKLGQQTYYVFDPRTPQDLPNRDPANANGQYGQQGPNGPPHNNTRLSRKIEFVSGGGQQPQQQIMARFPPGKPKYPGQIPSVNGVSPHFANAPPPELCKITLIVGKQKFVGSGRTLQSAKHDAASRALQVLRTQAANKFKEILTRTAKEGEWKSPISLVHEIAIKHNLGVAFKVLREEGPAHMKSFITICEVGDIVTEGDGNGKKVSKKRAAEKMLEELKKLPPPSPSNSPPVKRIKVKSFKRKTSPTPRKRNSIREKTDSECAEDTNPISRLIHIQQSRNEKEPTYELISRISESKKREFVMEATVPGQVARGSGITKKLAKRNAAQNLLIAMGFEVAVDNENENENEENNSQVANKNPDAKPVRKVKFSENNNSNETLNANSVSPNGTGGPSGRQIVPGVILLRQHSKDSDEVEHTEDAEAAASVNTPKASSPPAQKKCSLPTAGTSVRPKDQLLYLAQILGFQANFSDYPKGNHNEFLTIVTLSTAPPQICHGVGLNIEESQDQAASAALQILSKLGLDNIKPTPADD
ncbi:maternal effect protein staufen [Episyrphus balteatus]|uniref:maternal effect protein staufen n=1 Tax=Episyrphus balteatus TaxID=286459 RepID=UPI00248633AB|nr:maternal effect protein staufen [Episyrphus balteatus]XP_055838753.1 maternal effect protein staufen [Episyrphus balteatus]XP_055838754.1 maternal effect protein staufen [Episyrphus balteatus]